VPRRDLKDRVVVVTGAAGGLGLALCRAFGARGARLGLLDLRGETLDQAVLELESLGFEAAGLACDVTDQEHCRRAIDTLIDRFDGIDVLINNAGITHRSEFANTDLDVYRRVMEVSYFGSINCTKAALPSLLQRRGQIIAISSVAGFAPLNGRTGYAAAKHAMIGFFSSLRAELSDKGIGILVVTPSFIKTNIDANALGADGEKLTHEKPTIGKAISADTAAEAIVRAAEQDKRTLLITPIAKAARVLTTVAPRLYEWLMTRSLRSEFQDK